MAQFWQRQKIYAQVTALGPLGGRWRSHHVRPRLRQIAPVAVGTALADGPPHRSQRAELPHWAPASGSGGEAHFREGVLHVGGWYPSFRETVHPFPGHPRALAAAPQRLEPVPRHVVPEGRHRVGVAGHGVIGGRPEYVRKGPPGPVARYWTTVGATVVSTGAIGKASRRMRTNLSTASQ